MAYRKNVLHGPGRDKRSFGVFHCTSTTRRPASTRCMAFNMPGKMCSSLFSQAKKTFKTKESNGLFGASLLHLPRFRWCRFSPSPCGPVRPTMTGYVGVPISIRCGPKTMCPGTSITTRPRSGCKLVRHATVGEFGHGNPRAVRRHAHAVGEKGAEGAQRPVRRLMTAHLTRISILRSRPTPSDLSDGLDAVRVNA